MSLDYGQVLARLTAIDSDLEQRQLAGESAAADFHRAKRDYEYQWAKQYVQSDGTVAERQNATIIALYRSDAYKALVTAEAAYEGWKAAYRTLETRASIGQSLLKALQREAPQNGPQPSWSGATR